MQAETKLEGNYLPNNLNAKEGSIKNKPQKVIKDPFKILTFIITIYPIVPLALLSMVVTVFGLGGVIHDLFTRGVSFREILSYAGLLIWILGGTAGLIGLLRILKEKIDLTSLLLIIYGAISYSIVAVVLIMTSLNRPNFISIMHAAYLVFSLVIIGMLLIRTFKTVLKNKKKNRNKVKV